MDYLGIEHKSRLESRQESSRCVSMIRPCHNGNLDLYRMSCGVGRKKRTRCFVEDIDLQGVTGALHVTCKLAPKACLKISFVSRKMNIFVLSMIKFFFSTSDK